MDMTIDNEWNLLYSHNPKIQAFAVMKNGEIIWQTSNWDCVPAAAELADAAASARESLEIGGVKYKRASSSQESYIATADKEQGHLLMSRIEIGIWTIAWATHDAIPELTLIDLAKTAVQFMSRL
ncbi:MAG: hypothetical protein ACXADC_05215 [Candidatus Thorarchaeota archaeon]|jgi:tRNA(Glu) U13 pseudouridine synthase TruD